MFILLYYVDEIHEAEALLIVSVMQLFLSLDESIYHDDIGLIILVYSILSLL